GIRWIALIHDADWRLYDRLVHGPDLERVVASRSIELFRVRSWRGPVVTDSGRTAEPRRLVEPLQGLVSSGPGRWDRPAARGWMRGTRPVSRTSTGLIRLPRGAGYLWYWPTAVVVVGDLLTSALVFGALRLRRGLKGNE